MCEGIVLNQPHGYDLKCRCKGICTWIGIKLNNVLVLQCNIVEQDQRGYLTGILPEAAYVIT